MTGITFSEMLKSQKVHQRTLFGRIARAKAEFPEIFANIKKDAKGKIYYTAKQVKAIEAQASGVIKDPLRKKPAKKAKR